MRLQRFRQPLEVLRAADLVVQLPVIGNVIAVRATLTGGQQGRGVTVGNAQRFEVGDQLNGLLEGEVPVELEAVQTADQSNGRASCYFFFPASSPRGSCGVSRGLSEAMACTVAFTRSSLARSSNGRVTLRFQQE